jgi:hypothetical protein
MSYSYYKIAFGGYMVTKDNEPVWEVQTLKQAREDVRDLNAEEFKKSFLVVEQGLSLEQAADIYDDMNDDTYYTDAFKETAE